MTDAPCRRRGKPACGHDQMCGRCRAIWACDRMSDGPTNALENFLDARWAPHEYGKPRPAYYGDLPFVELPFVELLDYAKHRGLPREVDTLEDFHDKAAWMVLQGADIAIDGFSEAIMARAEGDDRFCLWCNQRDARERFSNLGKELGWAP